MRYIVATALVALAACGSDDPVTDGNLDQDRDGVVASADCNDLSAAVRPGAEEICDGLDNDCDGEVDEDATDSAEYFIDSDGDGFGAPGTALRLCSIVPGRVRDSSDCNDEDAEVRPGASRNELRDACTRDADDDGFADATAPAGGVAGTDCDDSDPRVYPGIAGRESTACMRDGDGDGYGDVNAPPGGMAGSDCDDGSADTFVGAAALEAPGTCARDVDGDGYGAAMPPMGVTAGVDCDDNDRFAFPGVAFREADPTLCRSDRDRDGYGNISPRGGVSIGTDCDDDSNVTFPGAAPNDDALQCLKDADGDDFGDSAVTPPIVSGTDCDDGDRFTFVNSAENELAGVCTRDFDGDGFGDTMPPTNASPGTDCDDTRSTIFAGAMETVADSVDQDCDGVDLCYEDIDGDGFGSSALLPDDDLNCDNRSNGVAALTGDCNVNSAATFPGAGFLDSTTDCNTDADGDGYAALVPEAGGMAGTDCNDSDINAFPGRVETIGNGVDNNCNTEELCFSDADGDGFGSRNIVRSLDVDCDDSGEATEDTDCDDDLVDGSACNENCGVFFDGSIDNYEISCTQPAGTTGTIATGLSFALLEARALRYEPSFLFTTDTDYIALNVQTTSALSTTEDWCAEYTALCEQLGARSTGCGSNFDFVGFAACEDVYNSYRPGDGHLNCNPSGGMRVLAGQAGFTDPTPTSDNSFGFSNCQSGGCSSTLCSGNRCNGALSNLSVDNQPSYTACRVTDFFRAPTPPRDLRRVSPALSETNVVRLTWGAPARFGSDVITLYDVYRGTAPDTLSRYDQVEGSSSNIRSQTFEYVDPDTVPGTTYFYAVQAFNDANVFSGLSNFISARPTLSVPGEVAFVGISQSRAMQLTWEPPVNDGGSPVLGYRVYRGDTLATIDDLIAEVDADTFMFVDFVRPNVLDAAYRVVALNAFGEGVSRPGIPTGLSFLLRETVATTFNGFGAVAVDYDVHRLALGAFIPQTENWCTEYRDFCALFGKFPTGCPGTNPSIVFQSCVQEYDAVLPVDNNLGCFPNEGVRQAAQAAGFTNATSDNSFAFGRCLDSDCNAPLPDTPRTLRSLTYIDSTQNEVYTLCRDP